ncbi:MAG: hypothetical protein WKF30_14090 [Pyrinomonadaceae bacterium]
MKLARRQSGSLAVTLGAWLLTLTLVQPSGGQQMAGDERLAAKFREATTAQRDGQLERAAIVMPKSSNCGRTSPRLT